MWSLAVDADFEAAQVRFLQENFSEEFSTEIANSITKSGDRQRVRQSRKRRYMKAFNQEAAIMTSERARQDLT